MMKKYFIPIIILVVNSVFAQEENLGIVVEYSNSQEVTYTTYTPPLRINQVLKQSDIDYSKIEGLVQSYYSASNKDWAMSEYLDKNETTARDKEHFEAVKTTDRINNYIQIESIYEFTHDEKVMAYIKYSFIMDKIPFPLIGIMSAQKVNNRWYISNLLNQYEVNSIFTNYETAVLTQLFLGKSNDSFTNNLIDKTKSEDGVFDFYKMINIYNNWVKTGSEDIEKVMDQRLLIEGYKFKDAIINSSPSKNRYRILHPFILDKAVFSKYENNDKGLIKNEKTISRFKNEPEQLLLKTKPIDLIHKFVFIIESKEYSIIKYRSETLEIAIIENKNNIFSLVKSDKFKLWKNLLLHIKTASFIDLFQDSVSDKRLEEIQQKCKGTAGGINIDVLAKYFVAHKDELAKYLDE